MSSLRPLLVVAAALTACDTMPSSPPPVSAPANVFPSAPAWQTVDLGVQPLFIGGWGVTGISNAGHIVGVGRVSGVTRAGLVSPTGKWGHLPPLPGDVLTYVTGVNRHGLAVGLSSTDPRYNTALPVVWNAQGVPEAIPGFARTPNAAADAINDAGVVIGSGLHQATNRHVGFVWRPGRVPRLLQSPAGGTGGAFAFALNDRGVLVGSYATTGQAQGFVFWDVEGRVLSYHLFPGYFLFPSAINNNGVVVGGGHDAQQNEVAWMWSQAQGLRILPTFGSIPRPDARGVDDRGRVFGFAQPPFTPLIWTDGRVAPIPPQGSSVTSGASASRSGYLAAFDTTGGVRREVLWIPAQP